MVATVRDLASCKRPVLTTLYDVADFPSRRLSCNRRFLNRVFRDAMSVTDLD